ncbi:uncharacterized protein [Euwallacea fornicatus]|uniref:uncharacterized protein n=1 Tax=Euwallacea fornicatus TaxID=995702 RepID=UPI00338D570A
MSTAPETHLLPPPKPKLSPMELRNTDLVSRLLAATPPYLYNMSLLPNTYFFSEMLRSLVQAKNEQRGNMANAFAAGSNLFYGHQMRRSRKRGWSGVGRESYSHQTSPGTEEKVMEKNGEKKDDSWMIKSMRRIEDIPAELRVASTSSHHSQKSNNILEEQHRHTKPEEPATSFSPQQQQENAPNLVLPPPPPMWYPPIYPTPPYGIDPLHFFIDLRVSGHIYDRQNNNQEIKETNEENSTMVRPKEAIEDKREVKNEEVSEEGIFNHQKRTGSAFSVPNPGGGKLRSGGGGQTKFDVKSILGSNKTSTSYIMNNITGIYKNFSEKREEVVAEEHNSPIDQLEADKQKKVKDLRALIGLELVVDYMSHKKEVPRSEDSSLMSEEGDVSSEMESCSSPPLEVVAVHDEV